MSLSERKLHFVISGPKGEREVRAFSSPRVQLGRDLKVDLHVDDDAASRLHAVVFVDGARVAIADLGSANGTKVNGELIAGPRFLDEDDVVAIGRFEVSVSLVSASFDDSLDGFSQDDSPLSEVDEDEAPAATGFERSQAKTALLQGATQTDIALENLLPQVEHTQPQAPLDISAFSEPENANVTEELSYVDLVSADLQSHDDASHDDARGAVDENLQQTIEVDSELFAGVRADLMGKASALEADYLQNEGAPRRMLAQKLQEQKHQRTMVSALLSARDSMPFKKPTLEMFHVRSGKVVNFQRQHNSTLRLEVAVEPSVHLKVSAKNGSAKFRLPKNAEGDLRAKGSAVDITSKMDKKRVVRFENPDEVVLRLGKETFFMRFCDEVKVPENLVETLDKRELMLRRAFVPLAFCLVLLSLAIFFFMKHNPPVAPTLMSQPKSEANQNLNQTSQVAAVEKGTLRGALDFELGKWRDEFSVQSESSEGVNPFAFKQAKPLYWVSSLTRFDDTRFERAALETQMQQLTTQIEPCFKNTQDEFALLNLSWTVSPQGNAAINNPKTGALFECAQNIVEANRFATVQAEDATLMSAWWVRFSQSPSAALALENLAREKQGPELWRLSSVAYFSSGQFKDALDAATIARALGAADVQNTRLLSWHYTELAQAKLAIAENARAKLLAPNDIDVDFDALIQAHKLGEALMYESALDKLRTRGVNAKLATTLRELGDLENALPLYDVSLEQDQTPSRILEFADVLFHEEQGQRALILLKQNEKNFESDTSASLLSGVIELSLRNHENAKDKFDRVLALEPRSLVAHNLKGVALARANSFGEAISAFEKALAIDADALSARYNRALACLVAATCSEVAEDDLYKVLEVEPGHDAARALLAERLFARQSFSKWRQVLSASQPELSLYFRRLGENALRQTELEKAKTLLANALSQNVDDDISRAALQRLSYSNVESAHFVRRKTLEVASKNAHDLFFLWRLAEYENASELALAYKNELMTLADNTSSANVALARTLSQMGEFNRADLLLNEWRERFKEDEAVRDHLLERDRFGDEAADIERELRAIDTLEARRALAEQYFHTKRELRAVSLLQGLTQTQNPRPEAFALLGAIELENAGAKKAAQFFRQALKRDAFYAPAYEGLSRALRVLNRAPEAERYQSIFDALQRLQLAIEPGATP